MLFQIINYVMKKSGFVTSSDGQYTKKNTKRQRNDSIDSIDSIDMNHDCVKLKILLDATDSVSKKLKIETKKKTDTHTDAHTDAHTSSKRRTKSIKHDYWYNHDSLTLIDDSTLDELGIKLRQDMDGTIYVTQRPYYMYK